MFRRILVPLDGSAFGEWALPMALAVARRAGSDVELVSVSEVDSAVWAPEEGPQAWLGRYLELVAEEAVEHLGRAVSREILQGRAAGAILDHARRTDVELIVLTSHGRGPLSRLWLGSTADALIREARIPVLVLRPSEAEEPDLADEPRLDHLVVPLDGSTRAETVLRAGVGLAALWGARVTLLRVVELPRGPGSPYLPHAAQHDEAVVARSSAEAERYLNAVAGQLADEGLEAGVAVRRDRTPSEGIVRYVKKERADLVAMATHGRAGVPHLVLGGVADKVLREGLAPVLLYRPEL